MPHFSRPLREVAPSTTSELNVAVGHGEDVHKTWDLGHVHSSATLRTFAKKDPAERNRAREQRRRRQLPAGAFEPVKSDSLNRLRKLRVD